MRAHQIRCEHDAAPLIALREQGEQHLHLGAVVLNVADVVEGETIDTVKTPELASQAQVALGLEQSLDHSAHRGQEHRTALVHQLVCERGHAVRLAGAGVGEEAHVGVLVEEAALGESSQWRAHRAGKAPRHRASPASCHVATSPAASAGQCVGRGGRGSAQQPARRDSARESTRRSRPARRARRRARRTTATARRLRRSSSAWAFMSSPPRQRRPAGRRR